MSEKFEAVLSKTKGTEEYKKALIEYNELKEHRNELDEKIGFHKQQQDILEQKSLELREAQIKKGAEAVLASTITLDRVKSIQERYDETYYDAKPSKKELATIREDSCSAIKELITEKNAIKQAMDAKMSEISEYIRSNNMERFDTRNDYRYQQLTAEYIQMKECYDRLSYSIVKLDENNKAVTEQLGDNYVSMIENTSKSNMSEINNETHKRQLKEDGTETKIDEDESIKSLRNRFAAFLNRKTITDNIRNDVIEVNEDVVSAQKMIDDYCNNELEGVISDDKKAVRLKDTVEFQDDDDFAKGLGSKERAIGVNGYNNGEKSYVKNSGPHPKKTAIHEHNHQLSCNDTKDKFGYVIEYKRGVSINGRDRQVNEALTELFTKKMMGADYPVNPNVGYRDNMLRMEKMESGFGMDILKEAYYQNKPELLKSRNEFVMGEGTWKLFSKAFDDSLCNYTDQEIFDKREHYRKYGTNLQTATDIKRQNAITYANKCATLFAVKSKGVN